MYRELLTDAQWNWLLNNQNIWYNEITVLWYSNDSKGVVICQLLNGPIYRFYTLLSDGTTSGVSTGQTGHDIYIGIKTGGQYLYADNGIIYYDSRLTIGIPINTPLNTRYEFEYIRIKDSKWLPANMYKIIENLSDVDVIPKDDTSRFNLALKWDNNMANKYMSPYLYQWTLGSINEYDIALMLKTLYLDKWNKSYNVLMANYNPLHNYDMNETERTDDTSSNSSSGNTHSEDSSNSTDNTKNKVYAYNSETGTNDSETDGTNESTSNNNTNTTNEASATANRDRNLTRAGNIGVKTSQSLVSEELELRKYILLEEVYNDIVGELTISYYGYN